mgnify:FL=1|jgi:hypothetical protein|tara:strand:+ start:543 stop:821 length:279 start_codon:yes stop_codon:yes gene_type:complete
MKICRDCDEGYVCEGGYYNPNTELDISDVSYTEKKKMWKCIDCDSINVGEMEDGEMVCIDCDEEVLGIWKEYKGGMMTSHNYPMVKRLGLDQ